MEQGFQRKRCVYWRIIPAQIFGRKAVVWVERINRIIPAGNFGGRMDKSGCGAKTEQSAKSTEHTMAFRYVQGSGRKTRGNAAAA